MADLETVRSQEIELDDGHTIGVYGFSSPYPRPLHIEYDAGPIKMEIQFSIDQAAQLQRALENAIKHAQGQHTIQGL